MWSVWFWAFLCYSGMGFLLEITFARLIGHPKRDRKCHLLLPVCPVYGLGALAILALPSWIRSSPVLLYLAGAGVATAAEWIMWGVYHRAAGVDFWDYTGLPGSVKGRVCLPFSLAWGVLALPLVLWVHPRLMPLFALPSPAVTAAAVVIYILDAAASFSRLRRFGTQGLRWYDKAPILRRAAS